VTTLLIATRNAHKVAEISQLLGSGVAIRALDDFPGSPAVVEDAATFEGNARKKAETLARWLAADRAAPDFYTLADDSGLEVDALGGAPGAHSARFAATTADGPNSPDADNNAKLLRLLEGIPPEKRRARFRCVLALAPTMGGRTVCFEGACEGRIAESPSGAGGFGYDPLFIPEGCAGSFAELGADVKNKISHRARALEKLRDYLDPNHRPSGGLLS
jgi:XTP/dITP diphosphohydrolase